jgi:alkylation response protein AidB-like acyl-CoA dehydrogenase
VTDDLEQLREGARQFCERVLRPGVAERDRDGCFPAELVTELASVGYLGMTLPESYGGLDLDPFAYVAVTEELGAADATARSIVSVSAGLVGGAILGFGTSEQRSEWLPALVSGDLGAFALTEPSAGSNPAEVVTRAVRTGSGWTIRGSKMFITNGATGIVTLVFARAIVDGDDIGVTCFLVPQSARGYGTAPIHGKLGLRAGDTSVVTLDDVEVPPGAVLGEVGKGLRVALTVLDAGRLSVAAGAVGIAREALEVSLRYAGERHQFGRPIAGFQLVQAHLADSHVDVEAARGLVERTAGRKHAGEPYGLAASTAKLFATEAAKRCADRAIQVHGGYGYTDEFPAQRLLRDARVLTLYEGTSEIQRLLIARELTGISAFT